MRGLWVALMIASVALAGCASTDTGTDTTEVVDKDTFQLAAGKGAIAGLLVDDRFRPIDLEDSPATESQFTGFVLLQETGEQVQTNENGEFTFVDLEPGTYTIRASASDHEAVPQKVKVAAGEFAEASVVARRVLSAGSQIITEEYSAFVPCQANAPAVTAQCVVVPPDLSDDTDRQSFWTNYTGLDASAVVIEMLSNKEADRDGALKVVVRNGTDDCYVINDAITEGNYMKVWLKNGEVSPFDVELRNCAWTNEDEQLVQIWAQGQFKDETQPTVKPLCDVDLCAGETADSRGVGVQAGLVVKFVISVFLGEPEVDIETYCVLC